MIDFLSELQKLRQSDCLRTLQCPAPEACVNLSTNDYLGLADDANLVEEFFSLLPHEACGFTASSSRLLTGNHLAYHKLEQTLSDLYEGRSALVFNCGYHANSGILPVILDKRDFIVADKLCHASLIDGFRLSEAQTIRYRHNDVQHLQNLLAKHRGNYERCVIVTESIFSMDGDIAPLAEIVGLKREFNCMLYVDEAHAVGLRGQRGEGLVGEQALTADVDILIGTCGKALASQGAYAITSAEIHDYLVNKCRTLIFTTALPPLNVFWTDFVIRKMQTMSDRRQHLSQLAIDFASTIRSTSQTHIVPYICGENSKATELAKQLCQKGFYVLPIRHPTVPQGTARLRFSLKANMTIDQLHPIANILCNT